MPSAAVPCSDIRANGLGQAHRDLPQCDRPSFKVFVPAPCWTSPRRRARAPGRRPGRRRLPAPPVPGQIQDRDGGRDARRGPAGGLAGRGPRCPRPAHDATERATEASGRRDEHMYYTLSSLALAACRPTGGRILPGMIMVPGRRSPRCSLPHGSQVDQAASQRRRLHTAIHKQPNLNFELAPRGP